jgi:RNA polymerase sigma-70 factor (sigma-E family)
VAERRDDFDQFVAASATRLLRAAYAMTGDRGAAEDLVQEVLERLYVAWPRIDDPLAYSRRALVNQSTNRWRHRRRHPETALTEQHDRAAFDVTGRSDERDAVVRAIATLPPRQRAVIVLRFLDDLSEADTAVVLGCSVGTVKSQTSRALGRLRQVLDLDDDRAATRRTTSRSTT